MSKLFSLLLCVLTLATNLVLAQVPDDLGNRFARATITENAKPLLMGTIFKDTADNLIVMGAPLADVIARAYGVRPYQVVGAPDWVYEAHLYDIEAVPPPAALIKADDTQMLRSLLADRFGLRLYRGTREVTMYVLEADRGLQHALSVAAIPTEVAVYATRRAIVSVHVGGPRARYVLLRLPVLNPGILSYSVVNKATLLSRLTQATREPVLDLTGLGVVRVTNASAVLALPGNLALMQDELEESGLTFERRTVRMNVVAITVIERPRLDVIDR